ncbi:MAG: hypothetical protein FJY77_05070 [Candidatus Altiarchaeales archaeon]|nr:hypothetical protein [Candidatus Altiarchaeales archaeon]
MAKESKADQLVENFEEDVSKLKGLFSKEEKFWSEIKRLKAERNKLNIQVKELSSKGKRLRSERDKLNEKVALLKKKRSEVIQKIKQLRDAVRSSASEKKTLSKDAGGVSDKIAFRLNKNLGRLLCEEMPLEKERKLFEDTLALFQKLDIAVKVDELQSSILSKYSEIAVLEHQVNTLSDEIRSNAGEAEEKHMESLKVYSELDSVRKKSDEFHKSLVSKYEELKPIRDKISSLKDDLKSTEDEINVVHSMAAKSREISISKKRAERILEAKQKFKDGKRISFDDFKVIIESDGMSSEN